MLAEANGRYHFASDLNRTYVATVYCKADWCGRGEYAEEIDVELSRRSVAVAKDIAAAAIQRDYDPDLRPVRVVFNPIQLGPGVTIL